eukprot:6782000-Pyramimonas_sp.AAC.1
MRVLSGGLATSRSASCRSSCAINTGSVTGGQTDRHPQLPRGPTAANRLGRRQSDGTPPEAGKQSN